MSAISLGNGVLDCSNVNQQVCLKCDKSMISCRGVTDAINDLLNIMSSAAPGQKECDDALRKIEVGERSSAFALSVCHGPFVLHMFVGC